MLVKKISHSLVIASSLMHVFCCGIPVLLSLTSLGAVVGISSSEYIHSTWFGTYEMEILLVSGALLLVTAITNLISAMINCRTDGACVHEPCDGRKKISRNVFVIALVLYALNVITVLWFH